MIAKTADSPEIVPVDDQPERPEDRQGDHLLAVVEDPVELAVDELLGGQLGDEQQVERAGVALAGEGGHPLGVDQDQAQDAEEDRDHGEHRAERVLHPLRQVVEERRRRARRAGHSTP